MAKAAGKPTRTWILWSEALEPVCKVFLSLPYAEQWLVEQLAAEPQRIEWRARAIDPPGHPLEGFWRGLLTVNSADNSVSSLVVLTSGAVGLYPVTLYGLEVVREDIEAALPSVPGHPPAVEKEPKTTAAGRIPTKDWYAWARKEYPKQRGESIAQWAKRVHEKMQNAPVTVLWTKDTCRRRYYDQISDPASPFTDPAGPFSPD
jgi:hypothetical protein